MAIGSGRIRAKFRPCFPHNAYIKPSKGSHSSLVCASSSHGRPLNAIPTILTELKARKKHQVLDENCSSDEKNVRKLGFASNDHASHKLMTDTGLASLNCKATTDVTSMGLLAHPLARLHLERTGKAKNVKCAVKKKNQRILMLTSQPIKSRKKEVVVIFDTLFLSLSMNLSGRCAFKASQGEVRGETSFHIC